VIVSVPVAPAAKGTPPSAMFKLRSTDPATTLVVVDAELLVVLPSLAFETDAAADITSTG
jgi:hypothetical protein